MKKTDTCNFSRKSFLKTDTCGLSRKEITTDTCGLSRKEIFAGLKK